MSSQSFSSMAAVVWPEDDLRVYMQTSDNSETWAYKRSSDWSLTSRSLAPFTVTTWSDTTDIHLPPQNNYTIQKYSGSFNGNWVKDQYSISAADPLINMTALSCPGPRIKLYVQSNDNSLLDFSYAPGAFARDMSACIVATAMLPNCGLSALLQNSGNDYSIHVYYGNFHHILQDRGVGFADEPLATRFSHCTIDVTDLIPRALSVPKLIGTDLAVPGDTKLTSQLNNPPSTQRPMAIAATGWYASETLCTLEHLVLSLLGEVGSTQNVSVFSQKRDNVLQEMRYDGQNWTLTGFIQSDVMPGTAMAEVHNDNASVVLADTVDRLAIDWVWKPAVRICQAATVTPIAATTWSNGADVRLYFQDKTNHVREFCITFRNGDLYDGDWVLGDLKMTGFLPGSIYQFVSNPERNEAGTNTTIAAFRSTPWGFISLYWAGSDKVLRQRGMYHNQWLIADLIGDLSSCGPLGAALVGPFTLTQLGAQRDCLSSNITDLGAQNGALAEFCQKMSDRLPMELKPLAEAAVGGIQTLADSVEQLSTASGTTFDQRVKDCHDQSVTVAKQFKDLYNKAHTILANATNLATDITYQQSTIGLKKDRVKELLAISKVMREGEEKVVRMKQDEFTANQSHIDKLQKANKDAEEKRDDTEKLRIIRDVLTLGLGEAGDWGSLNDAMKYADQLIGYADTAIKASTKAKDEAQATVDALNAELTQYTQLKSDLEDFDPVLQSQLTSMTTLAKQIHELENRAFDAGLALGSLVGKSSVLPVLHTAQQLATSVVAIETVAETDNRLSGVFVDNPDTMDAFLQAIANSPVQASETDDEGLV
ncbi:hypothetical protein DFH08DRAFT_962813 [Mycena albidolilacea]|uniref:Uncharacterized protein n=1 Tax=Mycena albidolilacea TaxID=1033008 RepID=A0AAD6ZWY0_9AGAR|nr:hypothetical protein DFH08DRAFT_962813 [Mycena albidolilacea]